MTKGTKRLPKEPAGRQRPAKPSIDKQWKNNGETVGRDEKGRFTEGHTQGFQPGMSGNPAGRPKAVTISEAYRQQLAAPMPGDPQGRTIAETIAKLVCEEAAKGNVTAAKEVADRTEGRPRQALEVDLKLFDWRELAWANGLSETDVLLEAKRLIESAVVTGGAESD